MRSQTIGEAVESEWKGDRCNGIVVILVTSDVMWSKAGGHQWDCLSDHYFNIMVGKFCAVRIRYWQVVQPL